MRSRWARGTSVAPVASCAARRSEGSSVLVLAYAPAGGRREGERLKERKRRFDRFRAHGVDCRVHRRLHPGRQRRLHQEIGHIPVQLLVSGRRLGFVEVGQPGAAIIIEEDVPARETPVRDAGALQEADLSPHVPQDEGIDERVVGPWCHFDQLLRQERRLPRRQPESHDTRNPHADLGRHAEQQDLVLHLALERGERDGPGGPSGTGPPGRPG